MSVPTNEQLVDQLNASKPPANETIGGSIRSVDQTAGTCVFEFTPTGGVINAAGFIGAGYVTQMLDQACAIAGIAHTGRIPTTLEIKTSCLRALKLGTYRAEGRVLHAGQSVAFIEGVLRNDQGDIVATATTTTHLVDMAKLREKSA